MNLGSVLTPGTVLGVDADAVNAVMSSQESGVGAPYMFSSSSSMSSCFFHLPVFFSVPDDP